MFLKYIKCVTIYIGKNEDDAMTIRRFFVNKSDIENNQVTLREQEHNHLKNVLRLKVGDEIIVVCSDEYDYHCVISSIDKNKTQATITEKTINVYNPNKSVTVYQALTKKDAMSNLVQRLTELGITTFIPLQTKNIVAKNSANKLTKLQLISNQSVKQCKRSVPTKVKDCIKFKDMITDLGSYDIVLFANETESDNNRNVYDILKGNSYNNVAIIVGSEGGFDIDEIQSLKELDNVQSISLGKRILRVETATIALTAIVLSALNQLS